MSIVFDDQLAAGEYIYEQGLIHSIQNHEEFRGPRLTPIFSSIEKNEYESLEIAQRLRRAACNKLMHSLYHRQLCTRYLKIFEDWYVRYLFALRRCFMPSPSICFEWKLMTWNTEADIRTYFGVYFPMFSFLSLMISE